jgi:hypothetical protein
MIHDGMHAEVWSDAVKGKKWQATVDRVDQVADVASGTYGVRLVLPNPDNQIPAGLRCRMQLVETPAAPASPVAVEQPLGRETVADAVVPKKTEPRIVADKPARRESDKDHQPNKIASSAHLEPIADAATAYVPTEAPVVVETPASKPTAKSLPRGFKAIERGSSAEVAVVEPKPEVTPLVAAETKPESKSDPVEPVAEETADAQIDPEQLAADLIDDEEEIADIEPVQALPTCRLAGPYSDEVKATRKVVALRRAGIYVDIKSVKSSKSSGYMIATPVLSSRAEAKALVAKLQAAGITDYYLPRSSRKPLRISLGLYKGPRIARRQIDILAKKGFEAELLPWKQSGSEYYLVIRDVPPGNDSKLLAGLPVPDGDLDVTKGFCNQLAVR